MSLTNDLSITQLTQFPTLETEEDVSNKPLSSSLSGGSGTGIINSLFVNLFRGSSTTANTNKLCDNKVINEGIFYKYFLTVVFRFLIFNYFLETPSTSSNLQLLKNQVDDMNSTELTKSSNNENSLYLEHKKFSITTLFGRKTNALVEETTNAERLIDYQKSEFKKYWMPDSTGKECYECYEQFSAFRRKHHCRLCGQIFCGKCSNRQINGADLGLFF